MRPKLDYPRKTKLTLTINPEVRKMLEVVSKYQGQSGSQIVENYIRQQFKRLPKDVKTSISEQIEGQMSLSDFDN